MVMKALPLLKAIQATKERLPNALVVLLTPTGTVFNQATATELSSRDLVLICGRYEGVDQRVIDLAVDQEISLGDFVLMGGEVPAMAVIEAVVRLVPGVIGNSASLNTESFHQTSGPKLLEAPQYTRPQEFEGQEVPAVLLSGNHQKIAEWSKEQSVALTKTRRPELLGS